MLKSISINYLILLLLIFQALGCSDDDVDPELQNLILDLVTMDSVGVKKNTFAQNENFVLAVQATNNSEEMVELGSVWDFCQLPNNNSEYLLVYKRKSFIKIPVGRPFNTPVHCLAINLPVRIPPKSQEIISGARWFDNPNNKPLDPGTYYSSFSITIRNKSFNSAVSFVVEASFF